MQVLSIRWATDLKPEKYLTEERAKILKAGGAVACALGVESGSPRVLRLIDKGAPIEVVSDVIDRLAVAGIAAEAMCFTPIFLTETHEEAVATLDFIDERRDAIGVYIVGEFGLTHGSLVAQTPEKFGHRRDVGARGRRARARHLLRADRAVEDRTTSARTSTIAWPTCPKAGRSAPTRGPAPFRPPHSILHYDRFGPGAFKDEERRNVQAEILGTRTIEADVRFDLRAAAQAEAEEAEIWATLVNEEPDHRARAVRVAHRADPAYPAKRAGADRFSRRSRARAHFAGNAGRRPRAGGLRMRSTRREVDQGSATNRSNCPP